MAQVAQRMGFDHGFSWASPAEIFDRYARLCGVTGALGSNFDISHRAGADYAALRPFLWPDGPAKQGGRFFGDGQFQHAGGQARMLPITPDTAPAPR